MTYSCVACNFKSIKKDDFSLEFKCKETAHLFCTKPACRTLAYQHSNPLEIIELINKSIDNKCSCGYDPKTSEPSKLEKVCTVKKALRNHVTFPSVSMCPEVFFHPKTYFKKEQFTEPILKRHWALIVQLNELIKIMDDGRSFWTIENIQGEKGVFIINQKEKQPKTFSFKDLQPGHTLVILYAKRGFKNFITVVHEDILDQTNVFKAPIKIVYEEADKLLRNADANANGDQLECFGCGLKSESLMNCGKCKLVKYCSRECQTKSWQSGHKGLCSNSDNLLRLSGMPSNAVNSTYYTFRTDIETDRYDYTYDAVRIPAYVPKCTKKATVNNSITMPTRVLG